MKYMYIMYICICILKRYLGKSEKHSTCVGNVYAWFVYLYMYITERYYMVHTQHLHVYMYIAEESQCSSFWYHVHKKTTLYMHIYIYTYIYIIRTSPAHHFPFPTTSSAPTEAALAGNLVSLKKVDDLHTGQERWKNQVSSQTPWGF